MTLSSCAPLLSLKGVSKTFSQKPDLLERSFRRLTHAPAAPVVRAVDGVDLVVHEGEVVGLVGESGCGKSTLGRMVAGITSATQGEVRYRGVDIAASEMDIEAFRTRLKIQMIFQDPFSSLNPRMRVGDLIGEAPNFHGMIPKGEYDGYVQAQLQRAGLDPSYRTRYPHQFSGGQRQRIGIARALAVQPEMLVCDESVASLDVSIQAQILNLFMDLREQLKLTYLFISHDLGVVEHISDRVVIMYLGRVVEQADVEDLFRSPNHPYTQALLGEIPRLEARKKSFVTVKGEIPSPLSPPSGCHFHTRCPHVMPRCKDEVPLLREIAPRRLSACHLNDQT